MPPINAAVKDTPNKRLLSISCYCSSDPPRAESRELTLIKETSRLRSKNKFLIYVCLYCKSEFLSFRIVCTDRYSSSYFTFDWHYAGFISYSDYSFFFWFQLSSPGAFTMHTKFWTLLTVNCNSAKRTTTGGCHFKKL